MITALVALVCWNVEVKVEAVAQSWASGPIQTLLFSISSAESAY